MKFSFTIWKFTITIDLFDLDLGNGDIALGIKVSWVR